jgi:ribonucleotide reductase beta subunit family protein with ferritin-like domain
MEKHLVPIYEEKFAIELADKQMSIFWLPDEVKVEKDIQDVLTNFTPAEKHAVITTLKLFSLYETHAGDEYWLGRFRRTFDSAAFHRMASVFGMFELAVHAPFYNKINELLNINTPEFYLSYKDTQELEQRMEHIDEIINDPDDLVSLGGFSMVEGVILYSQFGFLKHYQSNGKNKLLNVNRGLNFSLRDENLHSLAGAMCFKHEVKHKVEQGNCSEEYLKQVEQKIRKCARKLYEHEKLIIKMLFSEGKIPGITETQLVHFVESRINVCLHQLGFEKEFTVTYDPLSEWFYDAINNYSFNDFFSGLGSQYNRNWDEEEFNWKTKKEGVN